MSCIFAQYKNSLGIPREGIHKMRIPFLDIAASDTIFTIIGALLLVYVCDWPSWTILPTILGAFIIAIIFHVLFCVKTKMVTFMGLL
jgi:hypothetical protein